MSQNPKENFLDRGTLLAIVCLGASWMAWDFYMKKKYPKSEREAVSVSQPVEQKETKPAKNLFSTKTQKERTYAYDGKHFSIVFSSKGLGIKKITLNKFSDRQGNPVVFKSYDKPLFSTHFLDDTEPLFFQVKKRGKELEGVFRQKGIQVTKTILIDEEKYLLKTKTEVRQSKKQVRGLKDFFEHSISEKEKKKSFIVNMLTAYSQDSFKGFVSNEKKDFFVEKDLEEGDKIFPHFSVAALGGKYFGQAFINRSDTLPTLKVNKKKDRIIASIEYEFLTDKPLVLESDYFFGAKSFDQLKSFHKDLKGWVDFGFFSWLSQPLLVILKFLFQWTHNWGFAIVLLTLFIRLCLFPVNLKSYHSMKVMQTIQPEIKRIKEEHKKDPKKMNAEVMELMKKNKASPLGGCLPMFLQMPVFFALYRVLAESIELYQSPFVFWIKDLSLKDPYFILPVLAGATLFVQQKITPMNVPPAQARLLTFMPIVFSVFMIGLPSGLTLYIFVSGIFGLIQQGFFVKLRKKQ